MSVSTPIAAALTLVPRDPPTSAAGGRTTPSRPIRAGRMLAGLYGPVGIRLSSPRVSDATLQGNLYLRFDSRIGRRAYEIAVLTTAREFDHLPAR